jgi:3-hydroxyacyl-CoA dehydrogenase/enoyl-CoA hydratase/3-hydroxybutyryl-CoA epimerase
MGREVPKTLSEMVDAGKLGRKSGEGFYRWEGRKPTKPEASGAVPGDIEDRLILSMVNEAVACLADGIVREADLLDAGVIFGTGFAPFRGGPLKYARDRGISNVKAALERLADAHGGHFRPHPGLDLL